MSDDELVKALLDKDAIVRDGLFHCVPMMREAAARLSARGGELPGDWHHAAIRIGEELADTGPAGYYDFTSEQWRDWALDAAIKLRAAAGGGRWVSVKERLPEDNQRVLLVTHGEVRTGLYTIPRIPRQHGFDWPGVTHWMPLPPAPGREG